MNLGEDIELLPFAKKLCLTGHSLSWSFPASPRPSIRLLKPMSSDRLHGSTSPVDTGLWADDPEHPIGRGPCILIWPDRACRLHDERCLSTCLTRPST